MSYEHAYALFSGELAAGRIPSVQAIRSRLHVGSREPAMCFPRRAHGRVAAGPEESVLAYRR
jgi:hypothetical protein